MRLFYGYCPICLDFLKEAYQISERFDMPVLFRTTTRVSHSKSLVTFGERQEAEIHAYRRNGRKYVCAPANAYHNHPKVEANLAALAEYGNTCNSTAWSLTVPRSV